MNNNNIQLLILIFMIILAFAIVYFIYFLFRKSNLKKEIFDLSDELTTKEKMLKNRDSRIIELRKINHDNEKELRFLNALLENKNYSYASSHIDYLLNRDVGKKNTIKNDPLKKDTSFKASSKSITDLIAESIVNICKKNNIDYKYYTNGIYLENIINPSDLNTLLVNILDNSVEALLNTDSSKNKYIRLYVYEDNIAYYVDIKNNSTKIDDSEIIFKAGYSSSKKEDHGFGLSIVKEILDKYSGSIYVKSDDIITVFTLIIPKYNL